MNNKHDLDYWYNNHISMLGYARLIKAKLPFWMRLFARVFVDEKWLDRNANVIRVYYSYKSFAHVKIKDRFCYEFTLDELEKAANGDAVITHQRPNKLY